MPKSRHHICFVSDQNAAELLGALLPDYGAPHMHAIATSQMRKKGAWLKRACARHGLKCNLYELAQIAIPDIGALLDKIWLDQPDESWAVNITGGTKIMALAAYAWAVKNSIPAFYIDTGNRNIQLFSGAQWQNQPLPDILEFETLLNLYGYEIQQKVKAHVPVAVREALEKMIELASGKDGAKAFHALNDRAVAAASDPELVAVYSPAPFLEPLLAICKGARKLDYSASHISFRDEQARKWCNGIWLEEFVQATLARLQGDGRITSWASSVQVTGDAGPNELDAIFTANNRLHVLECKTSRLAASANSILYKADSLRGRVGGIFTKSMLCSLDPLTAVESTRAETMGIRTVIGPNLKNLRKILIEWTNAA